MLLVAGVLPAHAASNFTLENVTLNGGNTVYRAARLEITGSALSRDEMQALLAGTDRAPAPGLFGKVSATRIAAPELVADQTAGEVTQSVTYRDVVFDDVVAGRIGRASASGATFAIKGPQTGDMAGRAGAISFSGVDLPALSHMLVEGRMSPDEAARTVVAGGTVAELDVDLPSGGHGHVARIDLRDAGGRALAVPMTSLVDLAPKADAGPPSPERKRALSGVLADLLTSQSLAALDLKDVTIQSAPAAATMVKVAAFGLAGVAGGKIARTTLDGLSVANGSDATTIGHLALEGIDLTPLLSASLGDDASGRPPLRFDRIAFDGLATKLTGVGQPVSLSIGTLAVDAKDWHDLVPQAIGVTVGDVAFDLPTDDERARPLLDLGYTRLNLSLALDAAYDPARTELNVKRAFLSDPAIGRADLSTRFSNIGPEILGSNTEKARAALAAALFKHASLTLNDSGLLARMIETQARQTKTAPAEMRTRWAAGVRAFMMALLAENADRGAVADAAERFIRSGGRFALTADAPNGLGLIDVMLAGGVPGLLGKVKLAVPR